MVAGATEAEVPSVSNSLLNNAESVRCIICETRERDVDTWDKIRDRASGERSIFQLHWFLLILMQDLIKFYITFLNSLLAMFLGLVPNNIKGWRRCFNDYIGEYIWADNSPIIQASESFSNYEVWSSSRKYEIESRLDSFLFNEISFAATIIAVVPYISFGLFSVIAKAR